MDDPDPTPTPEFHKIFYWNILPFTGIKEYFQICASNKGR